MTKTKKTTASLRPNLAEAGFRVGNLVVLLRLDDWSFSGMEPRTIRFLEPRHGCKTLVAGGDEHGHVAVEFLVIDGEHSRGHTTHSRTVCVEARLD